MPKKIFDIIPSQKISSFVEAPKDKRQESFLKPTTSLKKTGRQRIGSKIKRNFLKTLIICSLFLILVAVFSFFFFSNSKIEIWPETEILTLTKTITIDTGIVPEQLESASWIDKGVIPGKIFKDQKLSTQEFFSSGKTLKEKKAKGIIRVYNDYSATPQSLLPDTRFVSTDGKLFRSVKKEVIPGRKYEEGKFVPGEIDIEVKAAEAGEDYNIEPSTFSIPGFAGTPKYTAFYGKSFSPMAGGFKGEVSQVVQEDLDKAKSILNERLKRESRDFLKTALPTGFVLLDETISQEIIEESYSAEAGAEAESFNLQIKIESKGLMFRKSDLEDFAKNFINLNIDEGKKFQEESLEINYSSEMIESETAENKIYEAEEPDIVLNLEIKAKIYPDIDLVELKRTLLGRSFQEIKIFLEDQSQIKKIGIDPGPFWRRRIPKNIDKVEIKLNLES